MDEQRVLDEFRTREDYFRIMRGWHRDHGGIAAEPAVVAFLLPHLQGEVLDAGCGEGSLCRWMATQGPAAKIHGVDVSDTAIRLAKESGPAGIAYTCSSLKQLPYPDGMFDLVTCISVIEHVVGMEEALREFFRVLRPGGRALVRTSNHRRPGQGTAGYLLDCLLGRTRMETVTPSFEIRPGHEGEDHEENFDVCHIPSPALLKSLLRLGFRVEAFTTCREEIRSSPAYAAWGPITRAAMNLLVTLPFPPFTHLGPSTVVLARKPS